MSKLLRYVAVYLCLGTAYSYHLNLDASQALKAEEQNAIQRRMAVYSYQAKKRKDHPEYSSEELRTKANRIFIAVVGTSVAYVMFGWCVLITPSHLAESTALLFGQPDQDKE